MKAFFTLLFFLFAPQVFSQQNIADIRTLVDLEVTVNGIVTNGDEFGIIRYFQDETAGLAAYGSAMENVQRGDSITITGTLKDYRNLLELDPISSVTIHSSNNKLPEPKILELDEIGENYEGQLVQINNVEIVDASGTFAGNQNYEISTNGKSGVFRVNAGSSIVGQVIPTGFFSLVAICSQYSLYNGDVQTGYQLLPRDMDDFISGLPVNLTSPVTISEITKNEFALNWETDVDATSEVRYKISHDQNQWDYIQSEISLTSENSFLHKAYISGLEPASIVYAQVFSVLETDTAFSPVGVYATQSNSTGDIKVYFNTAVDQTVSTGVLAQNIEFAMEDTLISYINRAEETIDFCIYNINNSGLSNVSSALNNAKDRGVKIRLITCGTTAHLGTADLDNEIPVLERPEIQDGGIMHNKFVVFDANSENADKSWVWTGSTNLTYAQVNTDANNSVFIQDQTLAKTYQIEFEEMWGTETDLPNPANAKFGAQKTDNTPHEFIIDGNRMECYFSPSDDTNQKIIDAIKTADNNLEIETMLITRTDIAYAIRDAKERGAEVQVITNYIEDNTEYVNDILFEALGNEKFIFDDLSNGILHHKLAIIDVNHSDSDPQVITGSHNWSYSANDKNDENTLIIHNAEIANIYLQQFTQRFTENVGNPNGAEKEIPLSSVHIFPNPTSDKIEIKSAVEISSVELYSLSGQKIKEKLFSGEVTALSLSDLNQGIYILKIRNKNGQTNSYKIIKQ